MGRNLLTTVGIKNAKPGDKIRKLSDGDKLQLVIQPTGSKVFRVAYRWAGKQQTYTIGKFPAVSLANARVERDKLNSWLEKGLNPKIEGAKLVAQQQTNECNTVYTTAQSFIATKTSSKSAESTVKKYYWCLEAIPDYTKKLPVSEITARHAVVICKAIRDKGHTEKAKRTHNFIKQVMEHAVYEGLLESNPVGSSKYLGDRERLVKHYPAVKTLSELHELMKRVEAYSGHAVTKFGLLMLAHTLLRPGELRKAKWNEIDFGDRVWSVPAARMKLRRPHRVPLTDETIAILQSLKNINSDSDYVFKSPVKRVPHLSENAMTSALNRLGYKDIHSPHGFRTTGSTILHNTGKYDSLWIEMQIAHRDKNTIRDIYNQADYFTQRRSMMEWWSKTIAS